MKRLHPVPQFILAVTSGLMLTACVGTPVRGELEAQKSVSATGVVLHEPVPLPQKEDIDSLAPYLRYALWEHPSVEAAYQDWRALASKVTDVRSLPDPRLTLQLDYTDSLMMLMPGAAFNYTTRGKRVAAGKAALAANDVAYREFVIQVLNVAANLRRAWIELAYANESVRLRTELVAAYDHAAKASGDDYATESDGDLSAIVNLNNLAAQQKARLAAMEDRRNAARASFKAAMGLSRDKVDPIWPTAPLKASELPSEDTLWSAIKVSNPELLKMRAMVTEAAMQVEVSKTSRTPDYSFGLMADVKANPVMFRPLANITLPVWKDKIQAQIETSTARENAATARVKATEINLAARLAQALYGVRSADRTLAYINDIALPSLRSASDISNVNFQSGKGTASAPAKAQIGIITAELDRLDATLGREMAATDLLLLSAGIAPEAEPLIKR